jgi:hypothetical protein
MEKVPGEHWGQWVRRPGEAKPEPALVVHMQPGCIPVGSMHSMATLPVAQARFDVNKDKKLQFQARQIALFDLLTGNLDRHSDNLLFDPENDRLLAIDHSRSFQYKATDKTGVPRNVDVDDSLSNYLKASGIRTFDGGVGTRRVGHNPPGTPQYDQVSADNEYHDREQAYMDEWQPVFSWWDGVKDSVREAFQKQLGAIKDSSVREHLARNFDARWEQLNEYARQGIDSFGYGEDWTKHPIPLYRYGDQAAQ